MGKRGEIELDEPVEAGFGGDSGGGGKVVRHMDSRAFGTSAPQAKDGEILTGDYRFLDEKDKSVDFDDDGAPKDARRFILTRLLVSPDNPHDFLWVKVNGRKARFWINKWCIVPANIVRCAEDSGQLGFKNDPSSLTKHVVANHPTFEVKEIAEPFNTRERVKEFQNRLKEEKGIDVPFACEEF